jgi:hypothetical protein
MTVAFVLAAVIVQTAPPSKVDIVSVTGCLRERASDQWVLVAATEPVPSVANAPQKKDIPTTAIAGKNEFRLIGVAEFALPEHKDHTVVVKGLHIKDAPIGRLNVTSIVTAVPSCAPEAGK